jgi:hypothetical protein
MQNSVGPAGAEALAAALCQNASLTMLSLSYNRIGEAGAVAIGSALARNSALREVNLRFTGIGGRGVSCIAQGFAGNCSLTSLDLSWNTCHVRPPPSNAVYLLWRWHICRPSSRAFARVVHNSPSLESRRDSGSESTRQDIENRRERDSDEGCSVIARISNIQIQLHRWLRTIHVFCSDLKSADELVL